MNYSFYNRAMLDRWLHTGVAAPIPNPHRTFWDLTAQSIEGVITPLSSFRGHVVLVTNTASRCGFTRHYAPLEQLWTRYRSAGLVVMGFPSNDFGAQEPGTDTQIQSFCALNYGVSFPMFSKGAVKGPGKQDVFAFLTEEGPLRLRGEVWWNFEKFLIDRSGRLIGRWRSFTSPDSRKLTRSLEAALKEACSEPQT